MSPPSRVEWIEMPFLARVLPVTGSPPSRVEWIEIIYHLVHLPRKWSPPSRVEWIEIVHIRRIYYGRFVSAFAGGVD